MEIKTAGHAGFCFGVERAVDAVYERIRVEKEKGKDALPIYTFGPVVHNEQVVQDLEKKGVKVIETEEELKSLSEGVVIIRAHGVPKRIYRILEDNGLTVIDTTCPFVKRIHEIVEAESNAGKNVIIIGNPGHPEVEGIRGWAKTDVTTVDSVEMWKQNLPDGKKEYCVVSQTTFNNKKFQELVEIIKDYEYNVSVVDTVCNATRDRQEEAKELALSVDAMIVVGGAHSSNSRKLYEICKKECPDTYFVQSLDDLHFELPKSVRLVGITAGASTPNNIIEEVQSYVRTNF